MNVIHMNPIVERDAEGSLRVSSLTIADGSGVQHKNVLEMITKRTVEIERFGTLAFETRKSGGMPTRVALLNEQQATLLMSFQKNTEQVIVFKVELVKGFFEMAKQLRAPVRELSFEEKMLEVMGTLKARVESQHQLLAVAAPKAESFDTFLNATGDYDVRDAAQLLHRDHGIEIGRTRLFAWLRDHGWLDSNSRPYQTRIDQGLLRIKASTFKFTRTNGEEQLAKPQVRITPKGLHRLRMELGGGIEQLAIESVSGGEAS